MHKPLGGCLEPGEPQQNREDGAEVAVSFSTFRYSKNANPTLKTSHQTTKPLTLKVSYTKLLEHTYLTTEA